MNKIFLGNNINILPSISEKSISMIYIDPPFNTNKTQKRTRIKTEESEDGDRVGFGGKTYKTEVIENSPSYEDNFEDFQSFLMPRIERAIPCLKDNGSLFVHLNWREVHYIKVALDKMIGRDHFMNEIIWSYDFGARSKTFWPRKHDTILWYVKDPENYIFNFDAMERIPYMAPGLVGEEKAAIGKTPTDVFWHTIVPTNGKEKTGYPTQKPLGVLNRIIKVHTNPGDIVLDFFAGSGTTGEAAGMNERSFIMIDENTEAVDIMKNRLAKFSPELIIK